jgi:hypothetical protein
VSGLIAVDTYGDLGCDGSSIGCMCTLIAWSIAIACFVSALWSDSGREARDDLATSARQKYLFSWLALVLVSMGVFACVAKSMTHVVSV